MPLPSAPSRRPTAPSTVPPRFDNASPGARAGVLRSVSPSRARSAPGRAALPAVEHTGRDRHGAHTPHGRAEEQPRLEFRREEREFPALANTEMAPVARGGSEQSEQPAALPAV